MHEIVVPDVLGDCAATIQHAREFRRTALKHPEFKYMGVLQGRNMSEVLKCFNGLRFQDYISVISIPKHLCKIDKLIRYTLAQGLPTFAAEDGQHFEYHCLGSSDWVREVVLLAEVESIRGIDSAKPLTLAQAGKRLAQTLEFVPRPQGYFDWDPGLKGEFIRPDGSTNDKYYEMDLINDNIRTFLEWAGATTSGG